ncbi:MAG: saccharopine dehydrogenase NADP-binding domain-containing protein, partial [Flavobacteriaceae bacterium]
ENISKKNMLLFGTGKIGRNTCENLTKHTNGTNITLINRTRDKAELVADKCNVIVKDHADLSDEIAKADVLIVATGAQQPTVTKELIRSDKDLLILDLSIPKNVSEDVMQLPNVTLVHLDHLSKITDETIERRRAQVPLAESIIEEIKHEFTNWLEERKFAPTIKALKQRLEAIKAEEIDYQRKKVVNFNEEQAMLLSNRIIQKITKHFANHLKESNTSTEESIEFISKVFQLEETINE